MKIFQKMIQILCTSLIAAFSIIPAFALPSRQPHSEKDSQLGSISITLEDTSEHLSKENVVFGMVRIADIKQGIYEMSEAFQESGIDPNQIETAKDLELAAAALKEDVKKEDFVRKTDKNGSCCFDRLETGLYLIYPIDTAAYENIAPFLIAVPTFDESSKEMIHDIRVLPKHAPHPTISVLKTDADDPKKTLAGASFTLYDAKGKEVAAATTNNSGTALFKNVKNGTYYLKETAAPQGYQLSNEKIEVVIDEAYHSDRVFQISVKNDALPSIKTGDTANTASYFIISLSSVGLIGLMLLIKKKKRSS